jgi:hypothetical protein
MQFKRNDKLPRILVESIVKHRKIKEEEKITNKARDLSKFKEFGNINVGEDAKSKNIQFCVEITKKEDILLTWKFTK